MKKFIPEAFIIAAVGFFIWDIGFNPSKQKAFSPGAIALEMSALTLVSCLKNYEARTGKNLLEELKTHH